MTTCLPSMLKSSGRLRSRLRPLTLPVQQAMSKSTGSLRSCSVGRTRWLNKSPEHGVAMVVRPEHGVHRSGRAALADHDPPPPPTKTYGVGGPLIDAISPAQRRIVGPSTTGAQYCGNSRPPWPQVTDLRLFLSGPRLG